MSRFIAPFRQFFLKATDAPFEYGEAAALMTLASIAVGRRELDYGSGIRPNLFMMLAGDSSVARKSTSVGLAKKLLKDVDDQRVGPRDYTVEGLLKWMGEKDPNTKKTRNKVTLFAEEFGADLARMEAYAGTMATDFCALYDGESFEKVRAKSGMFRVERPRVNLFAACAYPLLKRYVRPRDWMGGFFMRFLFVAPTQLRPTYPIAPPFPYPDYSQCVVALKTLRDDLKHSAATHSKLRLDPQAEQLYAHVMVQFQQFAKALGPVPQTYFARFGTNLLKLALLYQLDIDPYSYVTALAVQQAIHFCSHVCWNSFSETYRQTAMGEFETLFYSVYDMLREANAPVSRLDLARKYWGNELLERVVVYMKTHGIVKVLTDNNRSERIILSELWASYYAQSIAVAKGLVGP